MRKSNKMNGLFKAGFIILLVCIPMFLAALAVAYILKKIYLSVIFSAGGAFLAFIGIILVMFSKPKKIKPEKIKERKTKRHLRKDDINLNEAPFLEESTSFEEEQSTE